MRVCIVPLREILERRKDETDVQEHQEYARLRIRMNGKGIDLRDRVLGSEIGTKRQFIARAGQLVLSKIDARNGAFGILPSHCDQAIITGNFWAFAVDCSRLNPQFFEYFTKTSDFLDFCIRASEGTTNRRYLQEPEFLRFCMPLPPIEEQRRIVGRIEALAGKYGLARQLRVAADLQAASILDSHLEALFREGHQRGWKQYVLGDFVTEARYGTSEKTSDDLSGTPVLRMGNIQNGELVTSDLKYLHLSDAEKVALLLKPGDIVVNRTNSAELVGKCAVFRLEGDFAYASYLIRLRIDTKRAIPELLAAYINSGAGRAYMFAERKQMTGQANVNAQKLKMLPIRLPGLDEQIELLKGIERVRSLAKRIRAQQHLVGLELGAVLPSILNQAFSGQL